MNLLIDNYDSFSYNLYQYIGEIDPDITVIRNDAHSVDEIRAMKPAHVILSPGPGRPEDAGVTVDVAKNLGDDIPILGVCLGHQAICAAFGGVVTYASRLMHGKQSVVRLDTDTLLFSGGNPGCPLSFSCAGPEDPSEGPADHRRNGGGRSDGRDAPDTSDLRRTVPPGVDPDPGGKKDARKFLKPDMKNPAS